MVVRLSSLFRVASRACKSVGTCWKCLQDVAGNVPFFVTGLCDAQNVFSCSLLGLTVGPAPRCICPGENVSDNGRVPSVRREARVATVDSDSNSDSSPT